MSGMPSQASPSATATTPAPDLNKKKITGPTIVIAGGSQGSGRAIAIEAAKRGMNVVLAARSEGPLDEAAETVRMSLRGGYDKARVLPGNRLLPIVKKGQVDSYITCDGKPLDAMPWCLEQHKQPPCSALRHHKGRRRRAPSEGSAGDI